MSIVSDIREFPGVLGFAWREGGFIAAALIAIIMVLRVVGPLAPLAVPVLITYLAIRHGETPIPADLKVFLVAAFICALFLSGLAAYLMGWLGLDADDE